MKKILLGTSALIAFGSVALAAEAPKLTVSGTMSVIADIHSISGRDSTGATLGKAVGTGHDLKMPGWRNELHFTGAGKTDSGLTYGAQYQLRVGGAVTTDEASMNFGGDWGKVTLGQNDSVTENYIAGTNLLPASGIDGDAMMRDVDGGYDSDGLLLGIGSDDNAKIRYDSPSFNGIQVGLDYAPSNGKTNSRLGVHVGYSAKAGDVAIDISGQYATAKAQEVPAVKGVVAIPESGIEAVTAKAAYTPENDRRYHVGAQVAAGAVSVAIGYTNAGKGGVEKNTASKDNGKSTNIGVGYDLGGGTSVGAALTTVSIGTGGAKKATNTVYSVGAGTAIAPGASAWVEYNHDTANDGKGTSSSSVKTQQVIVGTKISF